MHYSKPAEKFTKKFFELCDGANGICITGHKSPDDDAIAAVLSLYDFLSGKYKGKIVKMIYTGERAAKYKVFKHYNKIHFVSDLVDNLPGIDLLVMLDGNQYNRFTEQPGRLKKFRGKTICIDHHGSPPDRFDLLLIAQQISSCVEIIYLSFLKKEKIDKSLAETLMLGILGDTGNFAYLKPNQTETLTITKLLMEIGQIEIQEFQPRYMTISKKVFSTTQELIRNTAYHEIENWPKFQTSFISREFAEKGKLADNEISEAAHLYVNHYLRQIEDYQWGFVIAPKLNGDCGISLRSLPKSVSVRNIMERMDIGGGHDRAAGGTFVKVKEGSGPKSVSKCFENVLEWIKKNKPVFI